MKYLPLLFILLLAACGSENDSADRLSVDSFTSVAMQSVFEFTESEEVAFQQISTVKTDNHGNILVRDFSQPFLIRFDRDGSFISRIGREGNGPGEFQKIISFLTDDDHLWVMDSSHKLEKFAYWDSAYVRVTSNLLEREDLSGKILGKTAEGILVANSYIITANLSDNPTVQPVSLISEQGEILRDSILTAPISEQMVVTGSGYSLQINKTYGHRTLMSHDGTGRIYTLWTDSLSIDTYTVDGKRQRAFAHHLQPIRLTYEEIDSASNTHGKIFRADMRRQLPEVKPLVYNLIIDDHRRIWVELLSDELGHAWYSFTEEGEPLYKIDIPKTGAELQEISGNRVLWSYINEKGAPTIAVSKIDLPE